MTREFRKWNDVVYVVFARKEFETLVTGDIEYFRPKNYRVWCSQDGISVETSEKSLGSGVHRTSPDGLIGKLAGRKTRNLFVCQSVGPIF